ncbi:hypothetical protein ON010_g4201 [Phytophthora cinnamomi]|nr:hypothetical protein ON010_g4201 [Phytophthora cinnamomi]
MSTLGKMSTNARKQHEEDVERLVKCRFRSEIQARKTLERMLKRAVLATRALKEELVVLRQENEGLRAGNQQCTSDGGKQSANHLKDGQTQRLTIRNKVLESSVCAPQLQVAGTAIDHSIGALSEKDRKIAALEDELARVKHVADDTNRQCQSLLKEKRDEAQRALQENEQLARCAKTLQSQLALLPQLKKQLELAKEKRAGVDSEWQKKLEQRDQSLLQGEEACKQKLAESAAQIEQLTKEKLELKVKLDRLEHALRKIDTNHDSELSQEPRCMNELETSMNQLQERGMATEATAKEAERGEVVKREAREHGTRLRQLAADASDAVEVLAEKVEHDLVQVQGVPTAHRPTRLELSSNNEDERDP